MNNLITIFKKPKFCSFVLACIGIVCSLLLIGYYGLYKKEYLNIFLGISGLISNIYFIIPCLKNKNKRCKEESASAKLKK